MGLSALLYDVRATKGKEGKAAKKGGEERVELAFGAGGRCIHRLGSPVLSLLISGSSKSTIEGLKGEFVSSLA